MKTFILLAIVAFSLESVQGKSHTIEQRAQWDKLYPKLNEKMARMEEILNFVDRFIGSGEFKKKMLVQLLEFKHLAQTSTKLVPNYLEAKDREPFVKALEEVSSVGQQLYNAIDNGAHKEARLLFLKLDKLRRKGHSKWAN